MNDQRQWVLTAGTYYQSVGDLRCQMAIRTIQAATECGYQMIVVDGSPGLDIAESLEQAGATVRRQQAPGMGASRKEALQHAARTGASVIGLIEAERYRLVPLLEPSFDVVETGQFDLIIPSRRSLFSYPWYQCFTEGCGNWHAGILTKRPDIDWFFGPRVMASSIVDRFIDYDGRYGDTWDRLFVPVLQLLAGKTSIGSCLVDYTHPLEQKEAEEGDEKMNHKRDLQLQLVLGVIQIECQKLGL